MNSNLPMIAHLRARVDMGDGLTKSEAFALMEEFEKAYLLAKSLAPGGYVACAPCGCLKGWLAELTGDSADDLKRWLEAGYRIMPCGEELPARFCTQHKPAGLERRLKTEA